ARLLYLAGRDRKSALEDRLAAAGYGLCVHVVYAADAVPALPAALADAIRTGRAQAAIHYSRRSAAVFCDLVARAGLEAAARRLRHAAISPDAARGLAALAPPDLRIAAAPNEAALLDALG
ncbi:MAG: uroporphyrinogen synthase, partial [Hyphomicrobiales bacterium]|nr:uroporphyrinogen synthase [Hyphomicrobiales bacterium]